MAFFSDVQYIPTPVTITNANNTGQVVKAAPGNVYGLNLLNLAAASVYVKLYDKATAPTSSDTPQQIFLLPASQQVVLRGYDLPFNFQNGISVRATTGTADNDTTSPATAPRLTFEYY